MLHGRCPRHMAEARKKKAPRTRGASPCSNADASGPGRFGCLRRIDADLEARLAGVFELHDAIDQRVDRVVRAHADVSAGVPLGAALPDDDVAGDDALATEFLDAAVFRIAVAPVARRADAFLVSHTRLV